MSRFVPDDPFLWYRTALFVVLAGYFVVTGVYTGLRLVALLGGSDPRKRLLRVVISYQLISFRVRPLAGELIQIVVWGTIAGWIWWLHRQWF